MSVWSARTILLSPWFLQVGCGCASPPPVREAAPPLGRDLALPLVRDAEPVATATASHSAELPPTNSTVSPLDTRPVPSSSSTVEPIGLACRFNMGVDIIGGAWEEGTQTVVRAGRQLGACCKLAPAQDHSLRVAVVVGPSVVRTSVLSTGSRTPPAIADCVQARIRKLRFPRPEGGAASFVVALSFVSGSWHPEETR
jgi:hypothetical protein